MGTESKLVGSAVLLAAAGATANAAVAADLPLKVPSPVEAAPSWQGFYVGGSLGASWLNSSVDDTAALLFNYSGGPVSASETGTKTTANGVGWLGGLQAGYNLQDRNFVYGVEADISWLGSTKASANSNHNLSYSVFRGLGGIFNYNGHAATTRTSKVDGLATFRARFGIDVGGTMPYITAGLALGDVKNSYSASTGGNGYTASSSTWLPGIVVGGGIEHMLSNNWTVRGEILWVGFKDTSVNSPSVAGYSPSGTVRFSNSATIAKIGMNYKF